MSILFTEPRRESSAEFASIDIDRVIEIEGRQRKIGDFLEAHGLDAVLLQRPENIAWFSAGADVTRFGGSTTTAALFLTHDARVVVTNNVDSPQLFEQEFAGTGFQLKERPWYESPRILIDDLCRGRTVGSDLSNGRTKYVADEFAALRLPLSNFEVQRLRLLGRIVAHAVEATCRKTERGRNELEIAGELAHRIVKYGAVPERVQVCGDDRGERHRHWAPQQFPVESYCHVSAVARRWGLHVAATRTVAFGKPEHELARGHQLASLVQATAMHFSTPDELVARAWARAERIYDKFGEPNAWHNVDQGELLGYTPCETPVVPNGETMLVSGTPIFWHPAIGPAWTGDSMLVHADGGELLTPMEDWPRLTISVKGQEVQRPAILVREI